MQVIILAAGMSTRLRPLTDFLPKPMLHVLGEPMLAHIIRQLSASGLRDITITTHFCADRIRDYFGDGGAFNVRIRYAHEEKLMNTAGSLKLLEASLKDDFLVIGGNDFLPAINLGDVIRFHCTRGGIGTIVFKQMADVVLSPLFGQGVLDSEQRLVTFEEKPRQRVSDLIHTTYQIYNVRALRHVPANMPCSIPEYLIRRILASGEDVFGYVTESPFICISTPVLYEQAQVQLQEERSKR